ncbi:hypothetical protein HG442_002745 [Candidatus Gracilibacteria bacterium]|nr:hypothetical protein [Candidatus Gracilibacteria bacterium]
MTIIIIPTPPDIKNSEYSAHIIEHEKLSVFHSNENAFLWNDIHGYTYTTYTEYHLPTDQKKFQEKFINHLLSPLDKNVFAKEKLRIKEELSDKGFYKKAIEFFGQKYFDTKYSYGNVKKISFEECEKYHQKYYTKGNILILDEKSPIFEKELSIFPDFSVHSDKISYYNFITLTTKPTPENFFIVEMLEKFLNIIVAKEQTKYTPRDVVSDYNSNILWVIIEKNMLDWVKNISKKEISFFVQSEKIGKNNFIDADVASLVFFGKILSNQDKNRILDHFGNIIEKLQEKIC